MQHTKKRVVSISLGTSKRDKISEVEILGQQFVLERIGTDGDLQKFKKLFNDLDGKVDALGVGGSDVYVVVEDKRYAFKQIQQLTAGPQTTPVVDGSGLKHTLERETIRHLQASGKLNFKGAKVLMVAAVDRFGMAQSLVEAGADVTFGDLMFGLGLPVPIHQYNTVKQLGAILLPIITQLPFKWFYPTGKQQEIRTPKFEDVFKANDIICGDWHFIRKYMPDDMRGKTIITQTLRTDDLDLLKNLGVQSVITTTPIIGGETFATNVMEGVIVTLIGKKVSEIGETDIKQMLEKLAWKPNHIALG